MRNATHQLHIATPGTKEELTVPVHATPQQIEGFIALLKNIMPDYKIHLKRRLHEVFIQGTDLIAHIPDTNYTKFYCLGDKPIVDVDGILITYDKLYQEFTNALHSSPHLTEELKKQLKEHFQSFDLYNKKVDNFSYAAKCFFDDALKTYLFFRWKETPYVLNNVNYHNVTEEYQNNVTTTISSDQCISEIISAFFEKCVKCETEKTPLNIYFELEIPPLKEIFTSNYLEGCQSNSIQPNSTSTQADENISFNQEIYPKIFTSNYLEGCQSNKPQDAFEQTSNDNAIDRWLSIVCTIIQKLNKSIKADENISEQKLNNMMIFFILNTISNGISNLMNGVNQVYHNIIKENPIYITH